MQSTKHLDSKSKLQVKQKREQDIAQQLQKHNAEVHQRGESLPLDQQVYRVKVVRSFLRAAVPLSKLDCFRDLLEENAYRLSDRRHMSDLVPFILKEEQCRIRKEIADKHVAVIFDGTTRLGEALAIVLRFVSDDWTLEQRLVRMQLLAKSLKGEEIARELIHVLSTDYSIGSSSLLAAMRDRASSNGVAMRTLAIVYPKLLDVGCFSHTIDHVGERFHTPTLSEFGMAWVSLFAHSPKTRMLWREQTGRSMPTYSATRWWSRWEVYKQLLVQFGDLESFLQRNEDIAPATRAKLLPFFSNHKRKSTLQIELAATINFGEPFVKATYNLEGDGPLALKCFEIVDAVSAGIRVAHAPNVEAIARVVSQGAPSVKQQLIDYAKTCVQPGFDYFHHQLGSSLKGPLQAFKAARLFSPHKVHTMQPDITVVDSLSVFPFLVDATAGLKVELPTYLAKAADVSPSFSPLEWWKANATELPCWSAAARKVLLVQPSSAASERVFSLLKSSFGDQQDSTLQDYIEASLMLQYNKQ